MHVCTVVLISCLLRMRVRALYAYAVLALCITFGWVCRLLFPSCVGCAEEDQEGDMLRWTMLWNGMIRYLGVFVYDYMYLILCLLCVVMVVLFLLWLFGFLNPFQLFVSRSSLP